MQDPGCHSQGAGLDELQRNLEKGLELSLENYQGSPNELPAFVGLQQIEVGE